MSNKNKKNNNKNTFELDKWLQYILNFSLVVLSIILIYLLCKETLHLIDITILETEEFQNKDILTSILNFFLYFEFIAMIIKYFQDNYHFPIRYFMYIGITATIRLIVVEHDDGLQTLYFTGAILLLVLSYAIVTVLSIYKKKNNFDQ